MRNVCLFAAIAALFIVATLSIAAPLQLPSTTLVPSTTAYDASGEPYQMFVPDGVDVMEMAPGCPPGEISREKWITCAGEFVYPNTVGTTVLLLSWRYSYFGPCETPRIAAWVNNDAIYLVKLRASQYPAPFTIYPLQSHLRIVKAEDNKYRPQVARWEADRLSHVGHKIGIGWARHLACCARSLRDDIRDRASGPWKYGRVHRYLEMQLEALNAYRRYLGAVTR